jgi:hypothetical protein
MKTKTIPPEKFDILLAFLPGFEEPGRVFINEWKGTSPNYTEDVVAFFRWANDPVWIDYDYDPAEASKLIADDDYITHATLTELRTLLTFCIRGERLVDGLWGKILENGRLQAILHRLQILKDNPT